MLVLLVTIAVSLVDRAGEADDVNVAGKRAGTATASIYGGGGVPVELNLTQADNKISGTISVRNRPNNPKNWDGPITGTVKGRSVTVEYWTPESRKVTVDLTLAD